MIATANGARVEWSVADFDWTNSRVTNGRKVGWALDPDKRCDFIAYAIPTAGKCYLLPFELLRQAALSNMAQWRSGGGGAKYPRAAQNNGYTTVNVAVPWAELSRAMRQQMLREYGSQPIDLPVPTVSGDQLDFAWEEVAA